MSDAIGPLPGPEQLSAYLDGQLTPDERAAVEDRLRHDPATADALAALGAARSALRGLPAVDPPLGFVEGLLSGRLPDRYPARAARLGAAGGAATVAALAMVVLGVGIDRTGVEVPPPVARVMGERVVEATALDSAAGDLFPAEVAGYELEVVREDPIGHLARYARGEDGLSVLVTDDWLDVSWLAARTRPVALDEGVRLWVLEVAGTHVVIVDDGGSGFTVVAGDDAAKIAPGLAGLDGGDGSEGPLDAFGDLARGLVEAFGLEG